MTISDKKRLDIPKGIYCYDQDGICPHWSLREDKPLQQNGYCALLGKGDWEIRGSDLWDLVKECDKDEG